MGKIITFFSLPHPSRRNWRHLGSEQPYQVNKKTASQHMRKSQSILLLLLLSRFSRVRLCETPETATESEETEQFKPKAVIPGKTTAADACTVDKLPSRVSPHFTLTPPAHGRRPRDPASVVDQIRGHETWRDFSQKAMYLTADSVSATGFLIFLSFFNFVLSLLF